MGRKKFVRKREILPDPKFNDLVVAKFVNSLMKDGKELGKMAEDWKGMSDSGQRLTLARLIDTRNLGNGEYEVAIRIRDRVTGQSLAPSQKFTVTQ